MSKYCEKELEIFEREYNNIQGHRKRWTGFETAITLKVET